MIRLAVVMCLVACHNAAAPSVDAPSEPVSDAALLDAAAPSPSRKLPIPPREQWPNGGGYCGETSIQAIGLYYGAWISQKVARTAAGGELLLGVNEETALDKLHFDYEMWDWESAQPQAERFLAWMKNHIQQGAPVIYAVYLTDAADDPDYDHIVPATGIEATTFATYDPADKLVSSDNYGDEIVREVGTLAATRAGCANDTTHGGCVPRNVDYGVAIRGVVDKQHVTRPVSMTVTLAAEPNVSQGAQAVEITPTVTARELTPGRAYVLLRYDDYKKVPTDATAGQFLTSAFSSRHDFVATGSEYTYVDPAKILSSGTTYYRCVPR